MDCHATNLTTQSFSDGGTAAEQFYIRRASLAWQLSNFKGRFEPHNESQVYLDISSNKTSKMTARYLVMPAFALLAGVVIGQLVTGFGNKARPFMVACFNHSVLSRNVSRIHVDFGLAYSRLFTISFTFSKSSASTCRPLKPVTLSAMNMAL
jgi:hypothetical protein